MNQSEINLKKIKKIEEIYNKFLKELNALKSDRNKIIDKIVKRIETKKIKQESDKLKK
ncbi:hypothetical protein ISS06_00115 [Patescibacteria group bacterium]|nr:hypothetical protein [Patescibacteria group bacterium]